MLERFYEPDSGQILVDGQPIEEYDVHHWRRSLAIVSQENVLFDKTIKENILYVSSGLASHLHPTHIIYRERQGDRKKTGRIEGRIALSLSFSAFPMFVPSLSWQNEHFYI
jgi:ABC-type iron transport system FetAB ATPase subunit